MRITYADYLDMRSCEARLRNLGRNVDLSEVVAVLRARKDTESLRRQDWREANPEKMLRRLAREG